jgi:hypothetical protein
MAKAQASRKSGRKSGKPGKAKPAKARVAKARRAKPVRSAAKAPRKSAPAARPRSLPPVVVEIPEIPPPLPAPIASFTF